MKKTLVTLLAGLILALPSFGQQAPATPLSNTSQLTNAVSYGQGTYSAVAYNYQSSVWSGGQATGGTYSITPFQSFVVVPGGRQVAVFSPNASITIGVGSGVQETVTPTSVSSGCYQFSSPARQCTITATFTYGHAKGDLIQSGTVGVQEAINDAFSHGGGLVEVDPVWAAAGGTSANISGATVYGNVAIEDMRYGNPQYWNIQQTASTFLAVPTVLSAATAVPSATPAGSYGTGTYYMCIAYVDVAGQEGACSTTFSQAGLASGSFIFSPPAASTGAVGYTIYISLTSGTYSLAYQVPLTSSVCQLTTIETVTPACAVKNTVYGQAGATATVTAITVNTSPVDMQLGGVSGTLLTGNPNGRTTYGYVPSSHLASFGIPTVNLAFTVGGIGSATPISIGTVNIPAGTMNFVGKTIRICGKYLNTDVNSSTQIIDVYYDAAGSNVAGSPVKLSALTATGTGTAAPYEGQFCENFVATVSGAGATAGSILPGDGHLTYALVSSGNIVGNGADTVAAAVASINLAGGGGFSNRLSIIHNNATGNATPQLQSLSIEVL